MNCMKCGRETENEAVFCPDCLRIMEKYPVHPLTSVSLPERREPAAIKKNTKHHTPSPEEQVKILYEWVRVMAFMLLVCIIAIVLMFKPTMHYVLDEHVEIGQNYSAMTTPNQTQNSAE